MKKLIAELETFAKNSDLEINAKKTFILTTNPKQEQFPVKHRGFFFSTSPVALLRRERSLETEPCSDTHP